MQLLYLIQKIKLKYNGVVSRDMSGKSSQHELRTEHPTLRKGITWKFILESVATQCGKEYDELGVPTKVSMAGQWERISECPLETNGWRQIARSY